MTITRFEPWNYLDLLHRDLDRIVGSHRRTDNDQSVADWTPAVDIVEEKDRFVLRADVPGVRPEDIDVSMDNGVLSLSGERHPIAAGEESGVQRIEMSFLPNVEVPCEACRGELAEAEQRRSTPGAPAESLDLPDEFRDLLPPSR